MVDPPERPIPLIAVAYIAYSAGLLTAFAGAPWLPVAVGIPVALYAAILRKARPCALAILLAAGGLIAATTEKPDRRKRIEAAVPPAGALERARNRAAKSIDEVFGPDAPMAHALLIADQHRVPPEMKDRYSRSGMVHMLSVSGLHVAIIAGSVSLVLEALRFSRSMGALLSVLLTFAYVAMIGAPAPAVRSAVMLAGVAASKSLQRPTSAWAGLSLGAAVPLIQPATVLDLGYQLSVVGIAGLIASASLSRRLLEGRLAGWRLRIAKDLTTSVVATVITAPIIAWHFGRLSIIGPVANLFAGPVISVLQPLLFLALALSWFGPLAEFLADAAHPLFSAFDAIATVCASVPAASVAVVPSLITVIAGGIGVIAMTFAAVSRYPARPLIVGTGCLCIVAWSPVIPIPHGGNVEMHVLDVGQGDAVLIRTDRGNWIVFDAGRIWRTGDAARSTIIPYVRSRGGNVRAFVLSHAHADHVGGAASLFKALKPDEFWDSAFPQGSEVYDATLRAAATSGVEWRRVSAGEIVAIDGVVVRFLAPDSTWTASLSDPNEASTIARVEYRSARFLLTGDAEREEEAWLLRHAHRELEADVLKVAHHGSSTSSGAAFLKAVQPSLAVISVGADNVYGHPSMDVLASLSRVGAQTLRTDQVGTIVIRTDGQRIVAEAKGRSWDISRK